MRLLSDKPWKAITRAVRKSPSQCLVAVAYFGQRARGLLPLRRGSVLIVDFSESAVRAGQTCPAEVLALLRRRVEVHSVANLHAKVFVVGRSVFVGSTNVSQASARTLVEAVAHGTDRDLVRESSRFVRSLRGEHVTEEHARRMAMIYRPPKIGGNALGPRKASGTVPGHARTWVVQLAQVDWDEKEYAAEENGWPIAEGRLKSPRRFEVEDFCWTGVNFARRVKPGDLVVQVLKETSGQQMVSPPERVLYLKNCRNKRGGRSSIVFLETHKALRRKSFRRIRKVLGRSATALCPKSNLAMLRDAQLIHRLHQLWPELS